MNLWSTRDITGCWKPLWFAKKAAPFKAAAVAATAAESCEYGFAGTVPTPAVVRGLGAGTKGSKAPLVASTPLPVA